MPDAVVEAVGEAGTKVKIQGIAVQSIRKNRLRLAFQVLPVTEGAKLSDIGSIELKASLKNGEDFLTETWVYRIKL
jgi:nucleoside-triphosphatase THEP1